MEQGEPQGLRRALLIGVTSTPFLSKDPELDARFPSLACAEKDVELVTEALKLSGYTVTEHHIGRVSELELGKNGLRGELRRFFASCEPGDTAFVYISSHGVTLGESDYLLAADAQPGDPRPDGTAMLLKDSLLAADPVGLQLGGLRKGVTAVVCLDACREAEPPQNDDSSGVRVPAQDVVWLYSCGAGQRSYADPEHGSWFAQALARALAPETPPTTFGEIMRYTEQEMRKLAADEPVDPPTVKHLAPFGQPVDALELCKGYKEPLPWTTMVTDSALWKYTSGGEAVHDRVKAGLVDLAEYVGRNVAQSGAHRADPWHDPTYPARFERRLVGLVEHIPGSEFRPLLSPAETAVLLAAPLVHEDITAVALEELRRVLDHGLVDDHGQLVVDAVEDVRRAHKQVQGTLETLRGRGLADEAQAAEHWLRHRFVADWDLLWERTGDYASVDILLCRLARVVADSAEDLPPGGHSEQSLQRIDGQLRQVLGHLTVEPGDRPRVNDSGDEDWSRIAPVLGGEWRARQLAQLLWTAGLLSADPRRMSSVLVNHLGAHEPLRPRPVVQALSEEFDLAAVGDLTGGAYGLDTGGAYGLGAGGAYGLDVRLHCPHPALHAAVEEVAARADAGVTAIRGRWLRDRSSLPSLLRGLPVRVTARQLVPEPGQYTAPLERFRLAEDEIRPLLMGAQLYGDKMLAVRELYQNALDACRLRDTRNKYGRERGENEEEWTGRITFTQGWDDEGRLYIQCEDNGTGMSRAKLTSMFARAGKRYEQDPEFMQERREWRRAGVTPVALNSRFGIGVFSYFMLAEEIIVSTAPVNRYGLRESPVQASRAEIQSGSGLLRITPGKGAPANGGTRIRLYLALAEDEQPPSLVETLQSMLWVSDYAVRAVEYARDDPGREVRGRTWEPGELKAAATWPGPAAHVAGTDVWLVQGAGQLLLDGVVIGGAQPVFGYVANLRERHRPVPSVDRNSLLSYDARMVLDELRAVVPRAAAQWNEVSLRWLWDLCAHQPPLAVALLDSLGKDVTAVLEPLQSDARMLRERLPLALAGCLPVDKVIVSRRRGMGGRGNRSLFQRWRLTQLEHTSALREEFHPEGYPRPIGLDALLFVEDSSPRGGWVSALTAAATTGVPVRATVKALRRYAIAGAHVPAVADIRAQLSEHITPAAADLYASYSDRPAHGPRPPAPHAPLLLVAANHRLSLGQCVSLLEQLQALGADVPAAPELDEALAGERFTRRDALVLAVESTSARSVNVRWRSGDVSITQLKQRVSQAGDDASAVEEVLGRLRRLAPLGFSVLEHHETPPADLASFTAAERLLLRVDTSDNSPWREGAVSMRQLVNVSEQLSIALGEASRILAEASSVTGIQVPDVPAAASAWAPPSWLVRRMQNWHNDRQTFGPWELLNAYRNGFPARTRRDLDEFREVVTMLDACGLFPEDRDWDNEALIRQAGTPTVGISGLGGEHDDLDSRPVPLDHCMRLAATDETLGDVLDRLEAAEKHLPLDLPQVPREARSLRVKRYDQLLLPDTGSPQADTRRLSVRTVRRLLRHSERLGTPLAPSLLRLGALAVLGTPSPPDDLDGPDAGALAGLVPDVFDHMAFDADLLGPGTLGPLELVVVAGRFGWTLRKTYDRYAPFRHLGLDVTVREPTPEEDGIVPHWADVIVLTEQLTGRAPAVSGEVVQDHITLCAEETDLPETAVREILGQYAALFDLRLPPRENDRKDEQDADPKSDQEADQEAK